MTFSSSGASLGLWWWLTSKLHEAPPTYRPVIHSSTP